MHCVISRLLAFSMSDSLSGTSPICCSTHLEQKMLFLTIILCPHFLLNVVCQRYLWFFTIKTTESQFQNKIRCFHSKCSPFCHFNRSYGILIVVLYIMFQHTRKITTFQTAFCFHKLHCPITQECHVSEKVSHDRPIEKTFNENYYTRPQTRTWAGDFDLKII